MKKKFPFILVLIISATLYYLIQIVISGMNLMNDLNMEGVTCHTNDTKIGTYCGDYIVRAWFNGVILASGVVVIFMLLLWCLHFLIMVVRWRTEVARMKLTSDTRQRQITEKTQEIAYLQRQLNNERNNRAARVDNTPPPGAEPEDERERLLPVRRSPDY